MKPIEEQFRAAAKLANEWRDTLLYVPMFMLMIDPIVKHGITHFDDYDLTRFMLMREGARAGAWYSSRHGSDLVWAGFKPNRVDAMKCFFSTVTVIFISQAASAARFIASEKQFDGPFASIGAMALLGGLTACYYAGGPKSVFNNYVHMWDYPRKNGSGGGTTQTQIVKNAFVNMGRRLSGLAPRPLPVPTSGRTALKTNSPQII